MTAFWKAISVFVGTIIGVGIFGLPWVAHKSGFFILCLYFLALGTVAIVIHLLFGEVILNTPGHRRFPGYVEQYMGRFWARIAFATICFGLFGAQLAYLVVGGGFLGSLLSPYIGGSFLTYVLVFFALGSLLIYRDIKSISWTEFLALILFFVLLVIFLLKSFPYIKIQEFFTINLRLFVYPYGVVLFSLWGSAILPEVKEILKGERKELRRVIVWGILTAALTYLVFAAIVFGTCGDLTSKDSISGMSLVLGDSIPKLGFIFGIITCFTSFLTLGLTLKKIFWYDIKVPEKASWAIASFLPLILFLIGLRQFISIISLTGAVAVGIEGFIVILLYQAFLKKKFSRKMNPAYFLFSLFFILGIAAEIFYFILK